MTMKAKLIEIKGGRGLSFSLIVSCLLVFWVGGTVLAVPQTPSFTLHQAIEIALTHHPAVRVAELNLRAAHLELEAARAQGTLPKIGFKLQPFTLSSGVGFPGSGTGELTFALTLPTGTALSASIAPSLDYSTQVWTFSWGLSLAQRFNPIQQDKVTADLQQKVRVLDQAKVALMQAKDTVVLELVEKFGHLIVARTALELAKEAQTQAQAWLTEVAAAVAAGQASELQRLEAKLAGKQAEIARQKRSTGYSILREELGALLGIEGVYELVPPEFSVEKILAMANELLSMGISLEAINEAAGVTKASEAVQDAEQDLNDTRAVTLPSVSLAAGWTSKGWQIGVSVDFDLFSPGHSSHLKLAQARVELAQERLQVAKVEARMVILNQQASLRRAKEDFERFQLEKEKWALEETIMKKKMEADLISTDEWTGFQVKKQTFVRDLAEEAFDLVHACLLYRQTMGMKLDWEEILP